MSRVNTIGSHNVLDGSVHPDSAAGTVVRGDTIIGNSTPKWSRLAVGTARQYSRTDGTDVAWSDLLASDINANPSAGFSMWNDFVQTLGGDFDGLANYNIGGTLANATTAGVFPNLGISTFTTSSTSGQGGTIRHGKSITDAGAFGNLGGNANWESYWIFRLGSTANVRFRIGFAVGTGANVAEPTDGIWLRYDTNAAYADAAFHYVCRSGSANTEPGGTPTETVDTNFHKLRIRSTTVGTILMQFDAQTERSIASGVPTANMCSCAIIVTDTTATKNVDLDFWSFRAWGLSR